MDAVVDDAVPGGWGPDGSFSVPAGKGWTNQPGVGHASDHTVWDGVTQPGSNNFANWTIRVPESGPFDLFVSWVPGADRATNATYQVYEGTTLRATVVVDQQQTPPDPPIGGTPVKSLGAFTKLNPATTYFSVRLLTVGASGKLSADAVFRQ